MDKLFKVFTSLLLISGLVFYVGCEEDATTAADDEDVVITYDSFDIQAVMSLSAGEDANAEIVRTVPGSDNQAVFVSSAVNRLTVIDYTPTSFAFSAD